MISALLLFCMYFQEDIRGFEVVQPGTERYQALLIGINDYQEFTDLKTPVTDVNDLAAILKSRYHFENVTLLLNEKATEQGIRDALKKLSYDSGKNDHLLVYFAGHGLSGTSQTGYWIPHDARKGLEAGYISNSDIHGFAKNTRAQHVLVISDSCFSGTIFSGDTKTEGDLDYRNLSQLKSRWVITSGNMTPVSDSGSNGKNSVFAQHLIETLKKNKLPYLVPQQIVNIMLQDIMHDSSLNQHPLSGPLNDAGDRGGSFIFWNANAVREDTTPYPPPWEAKMRDFLSDYLRSFKGRNIHVVNGGDPSICKKLEELEMKVKCEVDQEFRSRREVGLYCGDISVEAIKALCEYLDISKYRLLLPEDLSAKTAYKDCGRFDEIIIRN